MHIDKCVIHSAAPTTAPSSFVFIYFLKLYLGRLHTVPLHPRLQASKAVVCSAPEHQLNLPAALAPEKLLPARYCRPLLKL